MYFVSVHVHTYDGGDDDVDDEKQMIQKTSVWSLFWDVHPVPYTQKWQSNNVQDFIYAQIALCEQVEV